MSLKSFLQKFQPHSPPKYMILALIVFGYFGWHFSQNLILLKGVPNCGIWDRLQEWTFGINKFAHEHTTFANLALIISSFWIDFSCFTVFGISLYKNSSRPLLFLGLFLFFRQVIQYLVSLPLPSNIIWHYPGFPSILVTYNVSNDLYFSSHTGVSLIGALEIARFGKKYFTFFAFFMFFLEMLTVISFQIHYTMDVYTAIITVLVVSWIATRLSPLVDRGLWKIGSLISR